MFADIQPILDSDGLDRSIIHIVQNQLITLQPYNAIAECLFGYFTDVYLFHDCYINKNQLLVDADYEPIRAAVAYRNNVDVLFYINGELISRKLDPPKRLSRQPCYEFMFEVDSMYIINRKGLLFFNHGTVEYASAG